jgi:hypothetical protein
MIIAVDPDYAERCVFAAVRGTPHEADYARAFAARFDQPAPTGREDAFRALHETWFDRLGFRRQLLALVEEFAIISDSVQQLTVSEGRGRSAVGMELYGAPPRYAVLATMPVGLWLDKNMLTYWARFELTHVADLLDPAFGFDRTVGPSGATAAAENLERDRYAVLWACSVDARLEKRYGPHSGVRERRNAEFARAFGLTEPADAAARLAEFWAACQAAAPSHTALVAWARTGLPGGSGRCVHSTDSLNRPGEPCPICGFATHDWVEPAALPPFIDPIRRDFPEWTPARGLCNRCAELYRAHEQIGVPADGGAAQQCPS